MGTWAAGKWDGWEAADWALSHGLVFGIDGGAPGTCRHAPFTLAATQVPPGAQAATPTLPPDPSRDEVKKLGAALQRGWYPCLRCVVLRVTIPVWQVQRGLR